MAATLIRGTQVLNGSIQRVDMDTTTTGLAVVTKVVAGTNITLSSSGVDPGTGDVTISFGGTSGTWTALSYGTGWSETTTARYRVDTNGSIQTLYGEGIIGYASGAASLAFTLPLGSRPGVQRGCTLAGYDSSGDAQLFQATIATTGAVNIVPMVRQNFVWPSATTGSVYLDNLSFAL